MIILVVGYNRPHYYKQCIEAIQANNSRHQVMVSVDGGDSKAQEEYRKLTPQSYSFIAHPENLGIAHHLFEMRDLCFAQDRRMLMIEDDVVISPNYIQFIENMLDWSDQFDNVGAVTGWNHCLASKEDKFRDRNLVALKNSNWITYGMKRECWQDIRMTISEYLEKFIEKGNYRGRNPEAIRNWARERWANLEYPAMDGNFPRHFGFFWPPGLFRSQRFPTSQDGMMVGAFHESGYVKVNTIVNRCKYIGEVGEHGNRVGYANARFGEMTIETYDEDGKFEVIA